MRASTTIGLSLHRADVLLYPLKMRASTTQKL